MSLLFSAAPFDAARRDDGWPWWALLAVLFVAVVAASIPFGFHLPYWRHADQDLVLAYHGLLFNEGLGQEYFDHPGYLYFLLVGEWYRLLHTLGLLPIATLSALPPLSDAAAYDAAWRDLVQAGRALSILLCAVFVLGAATLVRFMMDDRRLGFLYGLALAFGVGVTTQARQMRTDIVSAELTTFALLMTLLAASRAPGWRPVLLLAAAGACATLALTAKVQAIFPLLAIPVLAIAFGRPLDRGRRPGGVADAALTAALAAAAVLAALPAVDLVATGIATRGEGIYPYQSIGAGLSGGYQILFAGWAAVGVLVHAAVWRARPLYAAQALAAVAFGLSAGLLALLIRPHPQNVIAVSNLIEHMFVFSSWRHAGALQAETQVLSGSLLELLLSGLWRTFAIRTVVLHPDNLPQTLVLEWFAIGAVVAAWRGGNRALAARVGLLLLTAWGLETVFSLRGFQRAYHVYTDPLVVLAAAMALAGFPALLERWRTRRLVYGGLALVAALSMIFPVIAARKTVDPAGACGWIPHYMERVQGFPFCKG